MRISESKRAPPVDVDAQASEGQIRACVEIHENRMQDQQVRDEPQGVSEPPIVVDEVTVVGECVEAESKGPDPPMPVSHRLLMSGPLRSWFEITFFPETAPIHVGGTCRGNNPRLDPA